MNLPGSFTTLSETPAPTRATPSPANWFVAGLTNRGPVGEATLITSLAQFVLVFGPRVAYSRLYDALDVFFREAGRDARPAVYVSRVVGPAAAVATGTLVEPGSGGGDALDVTASSPGMWANDIDVIVTAGVSGFIISVELNDQQVEISPELADLDDAVAWAAGSAFIRLAKDGDLNPGPQTVSLSGGTSDRFNAGPSRVAAALDVFSGDYGPGQVSAPGYTTTAVHTVVLTHADKVARIARLDGDDTATAAELISDALDLRGQAGNRLGGLFAPWDVAPGPAQGTTRTVPPCARNAGLFARSIAAGGSVGDPAAGGSLPALYVTGLSQPAWSDTDRAALNEAGVNVSVIVAGKVCTFGNRTLTSVVSESNWAQLSQSCVLAAIANDANAIGQRYVHSKVDGQGINVGRFGGELQAMCLRYFNAGDLYGDSSQDAFTVTPSAEINEASATTLATIEVQASPGADRVEISVIKTPIS